MPFKIYIQLSAEIMSKETGFLPSRFLLECLLWELYQSSKVLTLPKTALRLIAELGNVNRFHNVHALVAFAGIDTIPYQSGKFEGKERKITKRGSKYLRKVGYEIMAALRVKLLP